MTIILLETIDSTNRVALEAVKSGFDHGATWIADEQTEGRGRRVVSDSQNEPGGRRVWFSPAGKNIYMSVALDLNLPPQKVSPITILVGTIVCEEFRALGSKCWLKWPNDIYVGAKKLGGILTEAVTTDSKIDGVAVGIGLNINVAQTAFPDDLSAIATSLSDELDRPIDRLSLAVDIRRHLLKAIPAFEKNGLAAFADRISACEGLKNRTFEANLDGAWTVVSGAEIQSDGALRLKTGEGERTIVAGEIRLCTET